MQNPIGTCCFTWFLNVCSINSFCQLNQCVYVLQILNTLSCLYLLCGFIWVACWLRIYDVLFSQWNYKVGHKGIFAYYRICALKMCFKWGRSLDIAREMCFALPTSHNIKYRRVNLCSDRDWKWTVSGLCVDMYVKQHHSELSFWQVKKSSVVCHHMNSYEANSVWKLY